MNDLERTIRDAMRAREHAMEPATRRLPAGVRATVRRRRNTRLVAASVSLVAVTVSAVWLRPSGGGNNDYADPVPSTSVQAPPVTPWSGQPAPPGWRLESSLGVQIAVPEQWAVNNYGCGQDGRPTVVRGLGGQRLCLTPEPETKELAIIAVPGLESAAPMPMRAVTVGGRAGQRGEDRLPDGRYAGRLEFTDAKVEVIVRTARAETTARILDSLEFVGADHIGCPNVEPARAMTPPRTGLAPPAPESIGICNYGGDADRRLWSSARIAGAEATELARLLNQAPAGGNPDAPADQCAQTGPVRTDVVLLVRWPDGLTTPLWVAFSGCKGRGVSDGSRTVRVSAAMLAVIFRPLGSGYGFQGDLDGGTPGK